MIKIDLTGESVTTEYVTSTIYVTAAPSVVNVALNKRSTTTSTSSGQVLDSGSTSDGDGSTSKDLLMAVGISIAVILALLSVFILWFWYNKMKKRKAKQGDGKSAMMNFDPDFGEEEKTIISEEGHSYYNNNINQDSPSLRQEESMYQEKITVEYVPQRQQQRQRENWYSRLSQRASVFFSTDDEVLTGASGTHDNRSYNNDTVFKREIPMKLKTFKLAPAPPPPPPPPLAIPLLSPPRPEPALLAMSEKHNNRSNQVTQQVVCTPILKEIKLIDSTTKDFTFKKRGAGPVRLV